MGICPYERFFTSPFNCTREKMKGLIGKISVGLLTLACALAALCLAACEQAQGTVDISRAVYNEYVAYAESVGQEPLGYVEWINSLRGSDGKDGATWLTGEGAPSADEGKLGDLYLDSATCDVYIREESGWSFRLNIKCGNGENPAEEQVTVTFDYGDVKSESVRIIKGQTVELPCPEREGWVFLGWYCGEGANECKVSPLTPIVCDAVLKAKWAALPRFDFCDCAELFERGKTVSISGIYTGESGFTAETELVFGGSRMGLREAEKNGCIAINNYEIYRSGGAYAVDLSVKFLSVGNYSLGITFDNCGIVTFAERSFTVAAFVGQAEYVGGRMTDSDGVEIVSDCTITCSSYDESAILHFRAPENYSVEVLVNGKPYGNYVSHYLPDENSLTVTVYAADMGEENTVAVGISCGEYGSAEVEFALLIECGSPLWTVSCGDGTIHAYEERVLTATVNAALDKISVSINTVELTEGELKVFDFGTAVYSVSVEDGTTTVTLTFSLAADYYLMCISDPDGKADRLEEIIAVEEELPDEL